MTAREKIAEVSWKDDANRRGALLARLSAAPGQLAAERRLLPQGADARLEALLTEIDEIVLPRVLHLTSGAQDVAWLVVSHRRLIDVEMPGITAVPNDAGSRPDLLATRLIDIAKTRGALSATVGRRPVMPNHAETACSVTALRQALAQVTTETAFDRLLHQVKAPCIALTQWDAAGGGPRFSGPDSWMKPMKTLSERFLAMGRHLHGDARLGPQGTQGAAIPMPGQQILIMASLEQRGFAAVLPSDIGLRIISDWQRR
jgi:hypothetical protein